jgi:hypothetical protein
VAVAAEDLGELLLAAVAAHERMWDSASRPGAAMSLSPSGARVGRVVLAAWAGHHRRG